jgi:hypothetical protein
MSEKGCLMSRGLCSWLPVMARHKVYAQCQMCASSVLVVTDSKYIVSTAGATVSVTPVGVCCKHHLQSCQLSSTEIMGCDPGAVVCCGWVSCRWVMKSVGSSETSVYFTGLYRVTSQNGALFSLLVWCWVRWEVQPDLQGLVFNSVPERTSWVQLSKIEKSMFQTRYCWRFAYVTCETCTASESNRNDFGASASVLQQPDVSTTSLHEQGNDRARLQNVVCFEFMLLLVQEDFIWGFCSCGIRTLRYWLPTFRDAIVASASGQVKCEKGM